MKFVGKFLICLLLVAAVTCQSETVDEDDDLGEDSPLDIESAKPVEKPKYVKASVKEYHFLDSFDDLKAIGQKWIKSLAKKDSIDDSELAMYDGLWAVESALDSVLEGDLGLVLKSKAKHHAISARLGKPFVFTNGKPLVVQYEVKFQSSLECGGAYVKLLEDQPNMNSVMEQFQDKTGFSIMFGPDKCGTDSKFHFIVRFKHPIKGTVEEKHAKKSQLPDHIFNDGKTHLYTLIIRPDNTFHMHIDRLEVNSGSLLKDMTPSIVPDKIITDPTDVKPETWDDREKISDPDATKPDDWNEEEPKTIADATAFMPDGWLESEEDTIPDPIATRPDDWDNETDGEWEAPRIENPECKSAPGCGKWTAPEVPNPKYKGKWRAPMIDNVAYQGKWEARQIDNPDYFEIDDAFKALTPFSAMGLELWSMTENIYFDNFLVTDSEEVADLFAKDTWAVKKGLESASLLSGDNVFTSLNNAANEKPWLYAIYVLVVLIPVVLIVVFCCKSSPTEQSTSNGKKTDEVQPDDEQSKDDEASTGEQEEDFEEITKSQIMTKSQMMTKSTTKEDLEDKDDEDEEAPTETTTKSPIKRRARKV